MDGALPARARGLRHARPHAGEGATTFELFFDLVYVFAVTQVTDLISHEHGAEGVPHGLILFGMLWWTWCTFVWLGNQLRADVGLGAVGFGLALVGVFVIALAIPSAWDSAGEGLPGPVVLVSAYLFVRLVHLVVYTIAARDDAGLRRQIAISRLPLLVQAVLLVIGVVVGGQAQTALFAIAMLGEWLSVYLTSRHGSWRIYSASHWTERFELFVLIVLGESLVAVGVGAGEHPLTIPLLLAAGLGVVLAICLWWLYFDLVAAATGRRVAELAGTERIRIAFEAYVYGHFPLVAGSSSRRSAWRVPCAWPARTSPSVRSTACASWVAWRSTSSGTSSLTSACSAPGTSRVPAPWSSWWGSHPRSSGCPPSGDWRR
ncbi:Low temperature requirement A [Propionibacterium freudenreichii]|nr:low temperature requirement protein A [Propionibacterium freudenreichii]MDK9349137.1 low temperature requirement protein A [Propionibacterium freudenreichii]MDK9628003.1 low temperature requirement protein A [Propionibacterium freudenreichii]MDK9653386.1 low temperature requirement protein A [Propionibacterium freudenreichii]CEI31240.1 Low temperature requirement protein LtrA [Propionibacterium freudenreichii]SBN42287.1 Low temperature requirement A [Propionibacterium freudenreichii]